MDIDLNKGDKIMITVNEYITQKNKLLDEYESKVRNWLKEKGKCDISEKIPFFRDGVVCPEKWFAEGIKNIDELNAMLLSREEEKATENGSSFDVDDFFAAALKRSYSEE